MRRRLPEGVRMYTGDDYSYAELIAGDGVGSAPNHRHSDALLGIDATAAAAPLVALAAGDSARFDAILDRRCPCHGTSSRRRPASTRPASSSRLAERPSVALHDGGRAAEPRSLLRFADAFRLADQAGLLERPSSR
jgi:hypothetical protein